MSGTSVPAELREAFEAETRHQAARSVWVVSQIAFLLFPLTTVFDALMYPERLGALSAVRFSASAAGLLLIAALYGARRRGVDQRYSRHAVWAFSLICCAGLDGLILVAGGPESPYYAGITLLLLALLVAIPCSVREMALHLVFVIVQFNLAMLALDGEQLTFGSMSTGRLWLNANYFFLSTAAIGLVATWSRHSLRVREFLGRHQIEQEKARSEELLLSILPREFADELKAHGRVETRRLDSCTVLFSDFVGFTALSGQTDPKKLVSSLDAAFSRFDAIMTRWRLEKMKTIGDAYMCAGGVVGHQADHLPACILAGLEMLRVLAEESVLAPDGSRWNMRLGIHTGPVVAGVIGRTKFAYDLWGDTVNTASRLESTAQPRSINVATEVYETVQELFVGVDRGFIPVRGKGPLAMTRIVGIRSELAEDPQGRIPNERFFVELERWLGERGTSAASARHLTRSAASGVSEVDPLRALAHLSEEDRERLLEIAEEVPVRAGRTLIEEGQRLNALFLVLRGLVGVRLTREGLGVELGVLGPGEILGELSFVSLEPAAANVVGIEDGVVLRFDLDRLEALTAESPATGARLYHSLAFVLAQRVRLGNLRLFSRTERTDGRGERATRRLEPLAAADAPGPLHEALAELALELDPPAGVSEEAAEARVAQRCASLLERLDEAFGAEAGQPQRQARLGALVLRETFPILMRSELLRRLHASRAWSSDHEVVDPVVARALVSHDPLGRRIERWFLDEPLAGALRERTATVSDWLVAAYQDRPDPVRWRVTNLISGSAPELFVALEAVGRPAEMLLTCIDGDVDDLFAVGRRAREAGLAERIALLRMDLAQPPRLRDPLRLGSQDVVYLPELPPGLPDEALVGLLDEVHHLLQPGGRFLFGQLELPPPSRRFLQHVLGWPLDRRPVDALRELVRRSLFGAGTCELLESDAGHFRALALERRRD